MHLSRKFLVEWSEKSEPRRSEVYSEKKDFVPQEVCKSGKAKHSKLFCKMTIRSKKMVRLACVIFNLCLIKRNLCVQSLLSIVF